MTTKQYSCDLCKKTFPQKIDFTRHANKKAPCITLDKMQQLTQSRGISQDNKHNLSTIFKNCLDVLRNKESLTGDKALRTLAHLLDLRLLEHQFGTGNNQIDIDNYDYDFSSYDDGSDQMEKHKKKLLDCVRFTNLVKEPEENIPKIMKCLWDEILCVHPITKNIFLRGKGFDIQHQSTYKNIIDKLYTFDFESIDEDILGEAYEEVIKDVMTGKVLGQFFTPPKVKQMMIQLIDPQLKPDGTIETIFDPAMGTGGFLISSLRYLLKQSKTKNIAMDWDFISQKGLGGRETEPDTYQLAISNMLISSGHMFNVLEKGDSIRNPITNKYDIIFANPPFGIKGLNYDEILDPLRNEYMPIKTNSAVPLFLQAIIYMLNINGRCAIVLPDGEDLFSKRNTSVSIREYLMKTCDLKEIIYLPAGVFTHTSIKTCIFYFHKKKEGKDILKTIIKCSNTQKETNRSYEFSKTHQTKKVKYYDYNPENSVKHLLLEVEIEVIAKNNYSLNYAEYLKDELENEEQYEEGVVVKTLGEVCSFLPKSKRQASYGEKQGMYPFFKSSIKVSSYFDEPDYEVESLIIGDGGEPNINYGVKFSTSDHCYILQPKNKLLLNLKYVYYYLYHNLDMMQQLYTGVAIRNISKSNIETIKIPIPSLERQQEIVKYLDFIYEKCIKTSNEKIMELRQLNEYCLNNQKIFGENVVKTWGEICDFQNGYAFKSSEFQENNNNNNIGILQIKSIQNGYIGDKKITEFYPQDDKYKKFEVNNGDILIALSGATTGKLGIYILDYISYINQRVAKIICKNINSKYLYYWYTSCGIDNIVLNLAKGTAQPNISTIELSKMEILIPSLKRQKEIVEYCEFNNTIIKQLEKEIEQNKKQAQLFIAGIVKTSNDEQDEIIDIVSLTNSIETIEEDDVQTISSIEQEEDDIQTISSIEQEPNIINSKKCKAIRKTKVMFPACEVKVKEKKEKKTVLDSEGNPVVVEKKKRINKKKEEVKVNVEVDVDEEPNIIIEPVIPSDL